MGNSRSKSDSLSTTLNGRGKERATHSSACVRMVDMESLDSSTTMICHMQGDEMIKSLHKQQTLDSVRGMCQSSVKLQVVKISMSSSGGKDKTGDAFASGDMIMVHEMVCRLRKRDGSKY